MLQGRVMSVLVSISVCYWILLSATLWVQFSATKNNRSQEEGSALCNNGTVVGEEKSEINDDASSALFYNNDTTTLPQPGSCSCWNEKYTCNSKNITCWEESRVCCQRTWHVGHKMGYVMSGELLRPARTGVTRTPLTYPPQLHEEYHGPENRFKHREVVLTRNFVDALVAGYLYHKSGKECGSRKGPLAGGRWEQSLSVQQPDSTPWKRIEPARPVAGRSVCEYLADESEEIGMAAYADFALGTWYAPFHAFWEATQKLQDPRQPSTMFVCYQELASSNNRKETYRKTIEWLHPAGVYHGVGEPRPLQWETNTNYEGPNAADRTRLSKIVARLDREVFDHWISRANEAFGCKSSIAEDAVQLDDENMRTTTTTSSIARTTSISRISSGSGSSTSSSGSSSTKRSSSTGSGSSGTSSSALSLPLPKPGSCSCWNEKYVCNSKNTTCWEESRKCCKRTWHVGHKMGYAMSFQLLRHATTGVTKTPDRDPPQPSWYKEEFYGPQGRFKHREVVLTRNFVDALVAGYLYHKAGNECGPNGRFKGGNWEQNLLVAYQRPDLVPWKPGDAQERNICQYLADEPERVGLGAYADFAVNNWYEPYYTFWETTQKLQDPRQPSTLFVCYEELAGSISGRQAYRKAMEWLHPAGYHHPYGVGGEPRPPQWEANYAGSTNAADRDPELRARLAKIVTQLDREVFNNWISRANEAFGCVSSIIE